MALIDKLTAIADAVRGKTGKTEEMTLDQMATEIAGIETGGGGYSIEEIAKADSIQGDLIIDFNITRAYAFAYFTGIEKVILKDGFAGNYNTYYSNLFTASSVKEVHVECENADIADFALNPYMFYNCKSLTKAVMKKARLKAGNIFQGCSAMELFDTEDYSLSSDNLFSGCTNLKTLILRNAAVVTISAPTVWSFVFNSTPFDNSPEGSGGTVYVPQALIEEYKAATNWSVLYAAGTCNFAAIEGSEYE